MLLILTILSLPTYILLFNNKCLTQTYKDLCYIQCMYTELIGQASNILFVKNKLVKSILNE